MKLNKKKIQRYRTLIKLAGILFIIIGVFFLALAPLETYCYGFFSEGGRFSYEGFRFGSFMFANITLQIFAYYILGVIFCILGYGHFMLKEWTRILALALIDLWIIVGLPVAISVLFIFITSKEPSPIFLIIASFFMIACYFVIPFILKKVYKHRAVLEVFEIYNKDKSRLESFPPRVLVLVLLELFFLLSLQSLLLFNGIFPVLIDFINGFLGLLFIDVAVLVLVVLFIGTLKLKKWAWIGVITFFFLMTFSTIFAFLLTDYHVFLEKLNFPAFEVEKFSNIPLKGYHFACIVGIPLLLSTYCIFTSRKFFKR